MIKKYVGIVFVFLLCLISFISFGMEHFGSEMQCIIRESWNLDLTEDFVGQEQEKPFSKILAKKYFTDVFSFCSPTEEECKKYKEQRVLLKGYYAQQEDKLEKMKENISISLFGGINYSMSLEEMKKAMHIKFFAMKKEGLIISQDQFSKICGSYYTRHSHTDLSRVWGADYLRKKINEDVELKEKYDTPDYVIVLDNLSEIKVKIWPNIRFPIVGFLDNGIIYFKNIKGEFVGCNEQVNKDIGENSILHYIDISNEPLNATNYRMHQNVIEQEGTGKRYIIDTEFRSFHVPIKNSEELQCLRYAAKKFEYLNHVSVVRGSQPRSNNLLTIDIKL